MVEEVAQALAMDVYDRMVEGVQAQDLTFARTGFYLIVTILAWRVFWELADQHQDSPYTQILTWLAVCVAFWVASVV